MTAAVELDQAVATEVCRCGGPVHARGMCMKHYTHWRLQNPKVPTAEVIAHLDLLRNAGLGWRRIAELTGVPFDTLRQIPSRSYSLVETAERIMALEPPEIPHNLMADGATVLMIGSTRRVRGLIAIGYMRLDLVRETGLHRTNIGNVLAGNHRYVWASTARRIDEVFRRLQALPAPDSYGARRARARAQRAGWNSPLAWDEETIDDPAAEPYQLQEAKRTTAGDRAIPEDFADIVADHREFLQRSDEEIAVALGLKTDTFRKRLERAGIPIGRQLVGAS